MHRHVTRNTAVALLLLLTGCARGGPGSPAAPASLAGDPSPAGGDNARAAQVEAARILGVFRAPPGATRLAGPPPSAPVLAEPGGGVPGTPNLVDRAGWWTVRGDATTVLAAIAADPPAGSVGDQTFGYSDPTQRVFGDAFDWPALPGVLAQRQMQVAVVQKGADTAIRVDAVVTYLPQRPADAYVPPTATALTVTLAARTDRPPTAADTYGPVRVSDRGTVAKVAAIVNAAPMPLPGMYHCPNMPAEGGVSMTVDFTAGPGGAPVASVEIGLSGCGGISLTVPGGGQVGLAGGADQVDQIITVLGLDWPHQ